MPTKSIFGKTFSTIERSLDIASQRHGLITSNIANLDTQGYTAKEIDFEVALKDALEGRSVELSRTDPVHFGPCANGRNSAITDTGAVDIDNEMSKLAENNLRYRTSVEVILRKLAKMKMAITEGGR
jgi:flagellar basal-body rod protein FlgB